MKRIGLTGGVGSGKSQVLDRLTVRWNVPVIHTDLVARAVMEPGQEGLRQVVAALGDSFLNPDGSLCRPALARLIFQDPQARETVDRITHPLVWKLVQEELDCLDGQGTAAAVVESAVFSCEAAAMFDEIWYVWAPEEVRTLRLMESRGYSEERCRSMIASQDSDQEFRALAGRVIDNSGSWEETAAEIDKVMEELLYSLAPSQSAVSQPENKG